MATNKPQFPRDEKHFCQKCGQSYTMPGHDYIEHAETGLPVACNAKPERYTDGYKSREQGRHDHRPLNDFWAAMKESDRR